MLATDQFVRDIAAERVALGAPFAWPRMRNANGKRHTKEPFGWGPAAASHPFSRRVAELMEERGLLSRAFMSIQLCPPLVISKEEIDEMVAIVDESLSVAEREFDFA
jgi:adenosylmethionine-8-amino-7-oxononanoate aminotransferase